MHAFIGCTKWRSGQVLRMPYSLTHSQTLKDSATQLLIKYKSGALVTQFAHLCFGMHVKDSWPLQVQMNKEFQKRSENSMERLLLPWLDAFFELLHSFSQQWCAVHSLINKSEFLFQKRPVFVYLAALYLYSWLCIHISFCIVLEPAVQHGASPIVRGLPPIRNVTNKLHELIAVTPGDSWTLLVPDQERW